MTNMRYANIKCSKSPILPGDWAPDPIEDKKARARGEALIDEQTMNIEVNPHIYRRYLISVS